MHRSAAILVLLPALLSAPARGTTFAVHDVRSMREIGETTMLFVDNSLVATFHLDQTRPEATVEVTVPDRAGRAYRYDLCGTITVRSDRGTPEIHEVNAVGFLNDPDHRRYEALGADDFTLFYLADPAAPDAALNTRQRSALCRTPIS